MNKGTIRNMNKSVIRLDVIGQEYTQDPWVASNIDSVGTGFVLKDRIIATCAHVAYGAKHISGVFSDDPANYYSFRVVYACPDWDIALLTTDNETFWERAIPLELGSMPSQEEKVKALGFPNGCDDIKTTKGTVASIQYDTSSYKGQGFLSMHIDVEVNPGSSGGPIVNEADRVVGMACQNYKSDDMHKTQSYAVPVLLLQAAVSNYKKFASRVAIVPDVDFSWVQLKNQFQRRNLGLSNGQQGIMITEVNKNLPYSEQLKPGDIILAVDGKQIFSDGKYATDFGARISWHFIPNLKNIGDDMEFTILRKGNIIKEVITLEAAKEQPKYFKIMLPHEEPTFFNYNGCVFVPMYYRPTENIQSVTMANYLRKYRTAEKLEAIYISQILPTEWSNGLEVKEVEVIDSVNGKKIVHIWDLIDAFALDKQVHEVRTENGNTWYIPKMTAEDKAKLIECYGLPERLYSADLLPQRREQYFINTFPRSLLEKYRANKESSPVTITDSKGLPKSKLFMWSKPKL